MRRLSFIPPNVTNNRTCKCDRFGCEAPTDGSDAPPLPSIGHEQVSSLNKTRCPSVL